MTKPTHTHKEHGGRFAHVAKQLGSGPLAGQTLVIYHDLDKDVTSVTTSQDWSDNWRPIAADDCPVCLGSGHDHIKGNKAHPCGGCYGLGKVRQDGETPADRWQLAEVALGILQRQQQELDQRRRAMAAPEVQEALKVAAHERRIADSIGEQEQKWRDERGYGPGGRRMTGD